jgi:4-amino-4-deoxy-L-arabinose transferase-like glycosyltransferase
MAVKLTSTAWWRIALTVIALVVTAIKVKTAVTTRGTDDVLLWAQFAEGVARYGPVGIYGHEFGMQYNHPPLSGWLLVVINWLISFGNGCDVWLDVPTLVRLPAVFADAATAFIVFGLVRRGRPEWQAGLASLLLIASPAYFVISGFHGNTDSVFIMFTLLSLLLLVSGKPAWLAGVAFTAAISVKIVAVVILPVLLVLAWRAGRRQLTGFLAGSGVLFAVLWGPVLLSNWAAYKENVLSYAGAWHPQWGVMKIAVDYGASPEVLGLISGPGRFAVVLLSMVIPTVLLWRRPGAAVAAGGLSLMLFLTLSTAIAPQYLIWPLAAAYLVSVIGATVYNVLTSVFLLGVYTLWNNGRAPWAWNAAGAAPFTGEYVELAFLMFLTLLATGLTGFFLAWRSRVASIPMARDASPGAQRPALRIRSGTRD